VKPIARALADAARQLSETSDTARLDAELLMAEALHIDRDKLILAPPDRAIPKRFWTMVKRRTKGEPIAYITGRRAFWNIDLHVGPGVLVPRPDSEVLIASAIEHFDGTGGPARVLDLGTGPGT
jgi:release factor glutamine methyltransferase